MVDLKDKYRARDRDGVDLHYDQFILDADNALVFQQHELPILTRTISFEANGTGHSLIQASYQYYIIEEHHSRFFNIKPIIKMLNDNELDLKICFSYQDQSSPTNMVIMEVNLPSGFRSDIESDFDIDNHDTIQRIESKNFESTIILYFDNLLPNEQYCLNILADKISDVSMTKSSAIIVYDYYNLTRSDVEFYKIQK
ncbi:hypothetical protein DOY81_010569 [Sarcophaga bullata]|nr:hypothetical protein DOY81_010569 [Sarcophaga bullata]